MRFWLIVLALEAVLLFAFYQRSLSSGYLLGHPWIREGKVTIESAAIQYVVYLAGILALFDGFGLAWIAAGDSFERGERYAGVLLAIVSVALFIGACVALFAFAVFGFAQY